MSRPLPSAIDAGLCLQGAEPGRVIDPQGLIPSQLAGQRCAYPNCCRSLGDQKTLLGSLPDGSPVFVCDDHEAVEL